MSEEKIPFFSVIVPEHNSAAFMRKGLDSIREQSFPNYELIIVCDRCEDDTEMIARKYTDRVIEIDAGRCGMARNAGLDAATGEWILFMDDDDYWLHEYAFEMLANNVGKHEEDILAFSFIFRGKGYARNMPGYLWPAIWNKAWRREFIERVGARFPDWKHSDDAGFAQQTHGKAKIAYWDMPFYYYNYLRPGSLTWKIENGILHKDPAEDEK